MTNVPTQPMPQHGSATTQDRTVTPEDQALLAKAVSMLKPVAKRSLPDGVTSRDKQFFGLVRDVSSSMSGEKISELNMACHALHPILADPANKDGFFISVIDFNQKADVKISCEQVSQMNMPDAVAGGSTNFDSALKAMIAEIGKFQTRPNPEGWNFFRPHVLFLSDGHSRASDRNIAEMHELADVTAVAYGADADQPTLSRIASDGQVQIVGTDGGALRAFLKQVGTTMVSTLRQGSPT